MNATPATFDRTARKFHEAVCVLLLALGFVLGPAAGRWLVALVGLVLLLGRFWWPADIFRQLVWRVLEPARLLRRDDAVEDHETRRVARMLGGSVLTPGGTGPRLAAVLGLAAGGGDGDYDLPRRRLRLLTALCRGLPVR